MSHAPLLHHADPDVDSIIETFQLLAGELQLPELDWVFVHYDGEILVEGTPRVESDIAACVRWARFLGMSKVADGVESRAGCWVGVNGPWTLEIVAEVH
jgi:hypothetical protein